MSARDHATGAGESKTAAPPQPHTMPVNTTRPLDGLRVIDVGNFLAGPYAAAMMGEFGAEVLKVEHPIGGDPMRRFGTPTTGR